MVRGKAKGKRGPGRPRGSKNKSTLVQNEMTEVKRRPGRPRGSKNKSTLVQNEMTEVKRRPGRPRKEEVAVVVKRGPGRPRKEVEVSEKMETNLPKNLKVARLKIVIENGLVKVNRVKANVVGETEKNYKLSENRGELKAFVSKELINGELISSGLGNHVKWIMGTNEKELKAAEVEALKEVMNYVRSEEKDSVVKYKEIKGALRAAVDKRIEKENGEVKIKHRGRPKGSKNKVKVETEVEETELTEVKTDETELVEAVSEVMEEETSKKRRGRPKGSKNKLKKEPVEAKFVEIDKEKKEVVKRGPGRPKGSKNKVKDEDEMKQVTMEELEEAF